MMSCSFHRPQQLLTTTYLDHNPSCRNTIHTLLVRLAGLIRDESFGTLPYFALDTFLQVTDDR